MKKLSVLFFFITLSISLSACSTVRTVEATKMGDNELSCQQIENEIQEVKAIKAQAESDKGMSGKNVAAALLFWPAIIGNEITAGNAIKAANQRIDNLSQLYNKKCNATQ